MSDWNNTNCAIAPDITKTGEHNAVGHGWNEWHEPSNHLLITTSLNKYQQDTEQLSTTTMTIETRNEQEMHCISQAHHQSYTDVQHTNLLEYNLKRKQYINFTMW